MYYYILMKWRKITFGDFIFIVHGSVIWHLHNKEVYLNMSRGGCSAQIQKVYDDANITLRIQDNKQNCRRIATWHKYTFIVIRYDKQASKANRKILKCAYKNTPDNAENLEMLFSEMYILKNPVGVQTPPPNTPLDPRLNPSNPNFFDNII